MAEDKCEFRPECRVVLDDIRNDVTDLKSDMKDIRTALLGNGAQGIKTKVAVNSLGLKIIGTIALAGLAGAITAIVRLAT